jgi:hypothetical protein
MTGLNENMKRYLQIYYYDALTFVNSISNLRFLTFQLVWK